ncbi:hypothetical protein [Streptomyces sp. NPDC017993]|uniref:hypothetical protein n=1 Tax=Streptomyces sp. NPDC017993 TaxID=3365027 RepID=UPI0037ADC621
MPAIDPCKQAKEALEKAKHHLKRCATELDEEQHKLAQLRAAQPPDPKAIAAQEEEVDDAKKRLRKAQERVREEQERVDEICSP